MGTGLFLAFSVLLFLATTRMSLPIVGLALGGAAVIRTPATGMSGALLDRIGAKKCVVASNVMQTVGFVGYLWVTSFAQLVAAATVVQVGNSLFWVSYAALIGDVSSPGEQERWFGHVNGLRAAGLGLGALLASAAVAAAGVAGYRLIVSFNAVSYVAAAVLMWFDPVAGRGATSSVTLRGRWKSIIERLKPRGDQAGCGAPDQTLIRAPASRIRAPAPRDSPAASPRKRPIRCVRRTIGHGCSQP